MSVLLCNHVGALPHETVRHRGAEGGERGSKIALRSPPLERDARLDTNEATDEVNRMAQKMP